MTGPGTHPRHDLDRHLLHGVRMSLVAFLADSEPVPFGRVRDELEVTDPELSRQVTLLESLGYVSVRKGHVGRRPRTWLSITPAGRDALTGHVLALQRIAGAVPTTGDDTMADRDAS